MPSEADIEAAAKAILLSCYGIAWDEWDKNKFAKLLDKQREYASVALAAAEKVRESEPHEHWTTAMQRGTGGD